MMSVIPELVEQYEGGRLIKHQILSNNYTYSSNIYPGRSFCLRVEGAEAENAPWTRQRWQVLPTASLYS